MCNSRVKFGCFLKAIEGRGFDYVASGHYAQLLDGDGDGALATRRLVRGVDDVKDQSYFLCGLTQEQVRVRSAATDSATVSNDAKTSYFC